VRVNRLITADLGNSIVQSANFFGHKPNTGLLEELGWQSRKPQHGNC
jgi:hypothetical protein